MQVGSISKEALAAFLLELGMQLRAQELSSLFECFHSARPDRLSYWEFAALLAIYRPTQTAVAIRDHQGDVVRVELSESEPTPSSAIPIRAITTRAITMWAMTILAITA